MRRSDTFRARGLHRGDAITPRLVRTMPVGGALSSSTDRWPAQNWGLVVMAAATVITMTLSLGMNAPDARTAVSSPVGHQSLFGTPGRSSGRGGISIGQSGSRGGKNGRVLQEEVVDKPVVVYETQLELFLCNPSLEVEGNDAHLVDEARLATAISKVNGLAQADEGKIVVTIKTGPVGEEDKTYMCDSDGMLQWHAQVKFGADKAAAHLTTPAVMAAQANDYVAYSNAEFKSLLVAHINDEYATRPEAVDLIADDIVVATVGWIVTFPSETSNVTDISTAAGSSGGGLAIDLAGDSGLWAWWVWLIYALLVACCLLPLCCCFYRRQSDCKAADRGPQPETTRQGRSGEGLNKVRGPEWGITELDFEGDDNAYQNQEMQRDYEGAGRGVERTAYRASQRPTQQSVSGQAWMQEVGKKSAWAPTSSSPQKGGSHVVRRFDIDDEDADDGVARLRSKHPQYSFDLHVGAVRGGRDGVDDEAKS